MPRSMMVRKVAAIGAAVVSLTIAFVAGTGSSATATQGQPVIAGDTSLETGTTLIWNTNASVSCGIGQANTALTTCGVVGVEGNGSDSGVFGRGGPIGVVGTGNTTGVQAVGLGTGLVADGNNVGVDGEAAYSGGNGVWGHTVGAGSGVYGENSLEGNGVLGYAPKGTAVKGQTTSGVAMLATASGSGTALKIDGKAQFSRSGTATVNGTSTTPKSSIRVSNVALTSKSLVLTTPQKNVAGVWVQAAVPNVANSYVTIYLNRAVTVSYPIAWFIVEKP